MAEVNIFFAFRARLIVASESIKKVDKWIRRVYVVVCRLSGSLLHRPRNISVSPVVCIDDKLFTGGGEKQLGKKQRGCNLRKAFTYFFVTPLRLWLWLYKVERYPLIRCYHYYVNKRMFRCLAKNFTNFFLLCCAELQKYNIITHSFN